MFKKSIWISVFILSFLTACKTPELNKNLRQHVNYLASDALNGRESGSVFERMSTSYIKNEFEKIGLSPGGENGTYYQDFNFLANRSLGENNFLIINSEKLDLEEEYYPLNFSASKEIKGEIVKIENISQKTESFSNGIFLIEISEILSNNSLGEWQQNSELRKLALEAENEGAIGVIFYTIENSINFDISYFNIKTRAITLPVVYLKNNNFINNKSGLDGHLKVNFNEDRRIGRNVLGFIDNGAESTIIIAGHHDGLGNGEGEIRTLSTNKKEVYHGADDGASGISVLIEFAKWVKNYSLDKQNNYLFISFSCEEKKLLGSIYFTNNPTINLNKVSYMINMDHIGRMNLTDNEIYIYGVGTSPIWKDILNKIQIDGVSTIWYDSGLGLTDYTSFYIKNIPVLGFNTEVHEDFHTPLDNPERINYKGMAVIYDMLIQINNHLKNSDKLEFNSTKSIDPQEILKYIFRYTDYSFEGKINSPYFQ